MKLSDQVRAAHSQDGAILLDIRHGQMFGLNLVGSRILELLRMGRSELEISETVSREFSADREIVARDVRELLAHLESEGLIETRAADSFAEL